MVRAGDDLAHLHDRRAAAGEHLGADDRVGLHELPLVGLERALLEQDAIGDGDLADVVHRRRVQQQLDVGVAQPRRPAELGAHAAHPRDVHAGVVVARLGGVAEPAHDLELALAQVGGALAHRGLQARVVARDLLLGQRQRAGQRAEHPARRARVGGQHAVEVRLGDLERLGRLDGHDRGQARPLGEHGDLAERVPGAHAVEDQARIAARAHDGEQPAAHDVDRVAGGTLVEDDVARRPAAAARALGELLERVERQLGQQWRLRELACEHGDGRRLGERVVRGRHRAGVHAKAAGYRRRIVLV